MQVHETDGSAQPPHRTAAPAAQTDRPPSEPGNVSTWASEQALHWSGGMFRAGLLVIVPLIVALVTVALVEKRYAGHLAWTIQDPSAATLDAYRSALLGAVWEADALHAAPGWHVGQTESPPTLRLRVLATSRPAAAGLLDALDTAFHHELQVRSLTLLNQTNAQRDAYDRAREQIQSAIQALDAQSAEDLGAAEYENPLAALQERVVEIAERWATFRDKRNRLAEVVAQRDAMRETPASPGAVVASDVRLQAYAAHTALQEDERHLNLQLAQIRGAMLAVRAAASPALDQVLQTAEKLAQLDDGPTIDALTPAQRTRIEEIIGTAGELHLRATVFAQAWTRVFMALDEMDLEALPGDLVATYDRTAESLREYLHLSGQLLASLHFQVRALTESNDGAHEAAMAAATAGERFRGLQSAQQRFEAASTDLIATDNYLLDAALQSARGLLQRIASIRESIDAALEESARRRATTEHAARIDALTREIEQMRNHLLDDVDTLMTAHAGTERLADELPVFLHDAKAREAARAKRAVLAAQLAQVDAQRADWEARLAPPVDPSAVGESERLVAGWPANLVEVACFGLLAATLTLLAIMAITSLPGGRRTRPHPA